MKLAELLDLSVVQRLAEANYKANGMPIGILDAADDSILVEYGWQDICTKFHRANPETAARCRESDGFIRNHLEKGKACAYRCRNGLTDIGVPDAQTVLWHGLIAPKGVPADRMALLESAFRQAARSDKFREYMQSRGIEVNASSAAEFRKLIDTEYAAMGEVMKSLGLAKQ